MSRYPKIWYGERTSKLKHENPNPKVPYSLLFVPKPAMSLSVVEMLRKKARCETIQSHMYEHEST
jgi:hypothetical protein